MANDLTTRTLTIDTEGVISEKPIWIKSVRFFRAAYNDAATFTWWDENGTPDHHFQNISIVVSTLDFSNASFVAGAPAASDIVYIYKTSTGNNQFRFQTATAGDNTKFVADALNAYMGTVTDETKYASCKIWTPKVAFSFKAGIDTDAEGATDTIDFGVQGMRFDNLAMHTLSSSATVEIYVR